MTTYELRYGCKPHVKDLRGFPTYTYVPKNKRNKLDS